MHSNLTAREAAELVRVSRGLQECSLYLRGGRILNVYSGEVLAANVAIAGKRIAYVGLRRDMVGASTRVLDASGFLLCPGYIEPHCHPCMLYNPRTYAAWALATGTTTVVMDNQFFHIPLGEDGFRRLAEQLGSLPGTILWGIRPMPGSTMSEEASHFSTESVCRMLEWHESVQLAELTRWPVVLNGDASALDRIAAARRLGKRADGHMAGASCEKINSLAAAGLTACHESITAQEVLDRLRLGLHVVLRHSSLRPDLPELLKAITEEGADTRCMMLTTDGSNPRHLAQHGGTDYLVRLCLQGGVRAIDAYRMATLNPATYLRLDDELGGIAPGRQADILLLRDISDPAPAMVVARGSVVARAGELVEPIPSVDWRSLGFGPLPPLSGRAPSAEWFSRGLTSPESSLPIMELVNAVITRRADDAPPDYGQSAELAASSGLLHAALLDRENRWIVQGLVKGLGPGIDGLATSFNNALQLLVLGRKPASMAAALGRVYQMGGGIVLVEGEQPVYELPLPIGGNLTDLPMDVVASEVRRLEALVEERGYRHGDFLYTLLFLPCDFLPDLRLTSRGLLEVKTGRILAPPRPLS